MWINEDGENWTTAQVLAAVMRSTGCTAHALDCIRVGGTYSNGTIWFQRIS